MHEIEGEDARPDQSHRGVAAKQGVRLVDQ
jgi:hypothetical protein